MKGGKAATGMSATHDQRWSPRMGSAEMASQPRDFYNQQRPLSGDIKKQQQL